MQIGYLNYVESSSELQHHGIKGQKWGVENGPPYPLDRQKHNKVLSSVGSALKKRSEHKQEVKAAKKAAKAQKKEQRRQEREEKRATQKNRSKSVKNMTDQQLNSNIERLRKEKEYKQLLEETRNAGKKKTQSMIGQVGSAAFKSVATSVAIYAGKKVVSSFLKSDEDRARMFGKQWVDPLGGDKKKNKKKSSENVERVIADVVTEAASEKKKKATGTGLALR